MTEPPRTIFVSRKRNEALCNWHGESGVLPVPVTVFVNDEYILRSEYDKDLAASRQLYDAARAEVRELREIVHDVKVAVRVLVS